MMLRVTVALFTLSLLSFSPAGIAEESREVQSPRQNIQLTRSGAWMIARSPNFRVWMQADERSTRELAHTCEQLRSELSVLWAPHTGRQIWTPHCDIVVHANQTNYNQTLGRFGDSSVGSTRLNFDQQRVIERRIDLRVDAATWKDDALPHELTHVIVAERFASQPLSRWADEGLAMLGESAAKRQSRLDHLRRTLRSSSAYRVQDLVSVASLPPAHRRDAFYSQSLALTAFLVERSGPGEFIEFLHRSQADGLDAALRAHFDFGGLDALQSEWDRAVRDPDDLQIVDIRKLAVGAIP